MKRSETRPARPWRRPPSPERRPGSVGPPSAASGGRVPRQAGPPGDIHGWRAFAAGSEVGALAASIAESPPLGPSDLDVRPAQRASDDDQDVRSLPDQYASPHDGSTRRTAKPNAILRATASHACRFNLPTAIGQARRHRK